MTTSTVVMETAAVIAAEENRKSSVQEERELEREYAAEAERQKAAIAKAQASGGMTSVRDARLIMGDHFLGLDLAIQKFGLVATSEEINSLSFVPYSERTLEELQESFILVAVPPGDFITIRQAACKKRTAMRGDFSYDEEPFASRKMHVRWHLVSKEIARDSLFRSKADQNSRIFGNPAYERLGAVEMSYILTAYLLHTGKRMLRNVAAMTSDSIFTFEPGNEPEVWAHGPLTGQRLSRSFPSLLGTSCPKSGRRVEYGVFVGFNDPEYGIAVGTCSAERPMANIGAIVSIRPTTQEVEE